MAGNVWRGFASGIGELLSLCFHFKKNHIARKNFEFIITSFLFVNLFHEWNKIVSGRRQRGILSRIDAEWHHSVAQQNQSRKLLLAED